MLNQISKYGLQVSILSAGLLLTLGVGAAQAAAKLPIVTSKLIADCDATRKSSTTSSFSLAINGKDVGQIPVNVCFIKKGKVLATTSAGAYVTFPPQGLRGFLPYAQYRNLYFVDFKTRTIKQLETVKSATDIVIDDKMTMAVFMSDTSDGVKLIVRKLATESETIFNLPVSLDAARLGDFKLAPKLDRIAVAVAYGPEKERGEVYILDIAKDKYTLYKKTKKAAHIESWTSRTGLKIK